MGWWRDRPAMFMVRVALLILVVLEVPLLTNVGSTEVGADTGRLLYPTFGSYLSDRAEQSDKPMRGHERPTDETGSVDLGER